MNYLEHASGLSIDCPACQAVREDVNTADTEEDIPDEDF